MYQKYAGLHYCSESPLKSVQSGRVAFVLKKKTKALYYCLKTFKKMFSEGIISKRKMIVRKTVVSLKSNFAKQSEINGKKEISS